MLVGSVDGWAVRLNCASIVSFAAIASVQQGVPIITLMRFVTEIADQSLHVSNAHAEGRSSLADDIFFNHDAAKIVSPIFECNLPNLLPLSDPGALDVQNVVQIDSTQGLHPQVFVRANGGRTELRV